MEDNHYEAWPYNLLCRILDQEELQMLKAAPPAALGPFLTYTIREIYPNLDADVIILYFMGQMEPKKIGEMLDVSDGQVTDILAAAGDRLQDPLLKETYRRGLAWRIEHEKKEAYLVGYRRGYAYTVMYHEDIPSYGDGMFTDWLFDLPGQNHPIEYLEPSEEVYCQLYFVGIRSVKQILDADDKKLMTEYRLEPPVIGEIAKLMRAKGYSCPITRVRTTYRASSWIDNLLRAGLSETNAYELRYYAPADLMQTFEFVSKIALDSIDEMILQMYYHHKLSFEEIAEELGLKYGAVYARASKALRKLREPRFYHLIQYGLKATIREMLKMESECGFQDGFNRGVGDKLHELHIGEWGIPEAVLDKLNVIPIQELDIAFKTSFRLQKSNVETLADLVQATDQELLAIKGLGRTVLQQLRKKQREVVAEVRAAMAADSISKSWEIDSNNDPSGGKNEFI